MIFLPTEKKYDTLKKKEKTERRSHTSFIHSTVSWIFYHDARRIPEYVEEEEGEKDTERKRTTDRTVSRKNGTDPWSCRTSVYNRKIL